MLVLMILLISLLEGVVGGLDVILISWYLYSIAAARRTQDLPPATENPYGTVALLTVLQKGEGDT